MFNISKFTSVAGQSVGKNAEMHYLYETQDSAATIQKTDANHFNNYFAEVYSVLSEGNIITVRHMSTPDATEHVESLTSTVIDEIDYISGGERRDWFFSILVAYLLGKPHITIYKDLTTVVSTCDFEETTLVDSLPDKNIFHVTDLLNISSFISPKTHFTF